MFVLMYCYQAWHNSLLLTVIHCSGSSKVMGARVAVMHTGTSWSRNSIMSPPSRLYSNVTEIGNMVPA